MPAPVVHESPASPQAGPVDLASASLGQDGTELLLKITTRGPVDLRRLGRARSLCVRLERVRLCFGSERGHPVLRRAGVRIAAEVAQDGPSAVSAAFSPVDAGLRYGPFRWSVGSRWDNGGDRLGPFDGRAELLAVPKCFGAAAHGCVNPALSRVVTPTPEEALLLPGAPCALTGVTPLLQPCYFGVASARARETVALLGDSHAEHWRAALEVVAQAKRWRAVSITRAGCPVTTAPISRGIPVETAKCTLFNGELMRWLKRHPEVHTVFVSSNQIAPFVTDAIAGYRAAWRALPRTIRRIYVLRDTPRQFDPDTPTCVERLLRVQSEIGAGCAETRQRDLPVDPEAQAARGPSVDARVRLLDFTRFMCTATLCPPVVGGVLVLKDGGHLTRTFSTTLGPYVLKATG